MGNIFELKDGREVTIDTWGYNQLKDFVKNSGVQVVQTGMNYHLDCFRYLGPSAMQSLESYNSRNYFNSSENLTKLELQENMNLFDTDYHRALCIFDEDDLIGIIICEWINDSHYPFWCYHINFIDVHTEYKNLGVGTNLMKALDKANFLDSKVLQRGQSSEEGSLYISHVAERELNAENYALIPWDYRLRIPPEDVGVYDSFGKLISE